MDGRLFSRRWGVALVAACAALAALGVARLSYAPGASPGPGRVALSAQPPDAPTPGSRLAPAGVAPGSTGAVPPGATPEQWRALREELHSRPDGAAELARISEYLDWSDLVRRMRASSGDAAERERLARAVDAGLPARLRQGEVSSAEARQIKAAVLEATIADPDERAAALQRWLEAEMRPASADPRQAVFERRQAEIVAAWSARPPAERDAVALQRDLDALRREVFAPASPAAR